MFGQFPLAGAAAVPLAGALVVPEPDVDWFVEELPVDEAADGVVVVVELLSAANASAAPPPTRAPVKASATADLWIHFMVITSSMVLARWFWLDGSGSMVLARCLVVRVIVKRLCARAARERGQSGARLQATG
jgi:hypothetical protein